MIITKTDIITKIRTAIDDIIPSGVTDNFTSNTDNELWQAVQHTVTSLSENLPVNLLDISVESLNGTVDTARGFAYGEVPEEFLRFVSIDIAGTSGILNELIEPGSNMEKMQRSPWSRGSNTKPKAMMDHDETGEKVIVWWPGDEAHDTAQLFYIKLPKLYTQTTETITTVPAIDCAIREEAEQMIIYQAAAIFFEGKKESETAEKFKNI